MEAPDITVSTESPAPSMIAFVVLPAASTDAPLINVMVTLAPEAVSVLIAVFRRPAVRAALDTTMVVSPVPSLSTTIP